MPYIKQKDRNRFKDVVKALLSNLPNNAGEINYLFTWICRLYVIKSGSCYQSYNDVLGALEGVKLELYRRQIAPYEDEKIKEEGDL